MNEIRNMKYERMAKQIKSNAIRGIEKSFISLKTGDVSTEEFTGYQWAIESENVYRIWAMNDSEADEDKLVDLITRGLENLERVLTSRGSM